MKRFTLLALFAFSLSAAGFDVPVHPERSRGAGSTGSPGAVSEGDPLASKKKDKKKEKDEEDEESFFPSLAPFPV